MQKDLLQFAKLTKARKNLQRAHRTQRVTFNNIASTVYFGKDLYDRVTLEEIYCNIIRNLYRNL